MKHLDKVGLLAQFFTAGIRLKDIKAILTDVIGDRIPTIEIPFRGVKNPSLEDFWLKMLSSLYDTKRRRAIILGMSGVYDHWTVVRKITENQIKLFDSSRLGPLNRSECTTAYMAGKRCHVLWPAQTYFLGRE